MFCVCGWGGGFPNMHKSIFALLSSMQVRMWLSSQLSIFGCCICFCQSLYLNFFLKYNYKSQSIENFMVLSKWLYLYEEIYGCRVQWSLTHTHTHTHQEVYSDELFPFQPKSISSLEYNTCQVVSWNFKCPYNCTSHQFLFSRLKSNCIAIGKIRLLILPMNYYTVLLTEPNLWTSEI